ncbi:AAA family ATPase [Hymenobacter sp. 5516J-16]|uniref:AAA family ATPase n=1 Tax=Hymenobacter sp. 5516J-16 TaxID=2932253 RepID=UPI001FD450C3|nr:AAA family ATPase [Hymenobacter sp. 5516J-16]UOQ76534.1 AAA family ATPase [Hymenobacter sp. 5516J-16]
MQRIELDNFRVYGTPAAFDLTPVTLLTGKNNSGKSSLIKAFLVLADYLEQDDQTVLRLDGPRASRHRINSWENLVNWQHGSKVFQIGYQSGRFRFTYEFEVAPDGKLCHLRRFHMDEPEIDQLTLTSNDGSQIYQLSVSQKFLDYVTADGLGQQMIRRSYPGGNAQWQAHHEDEVAELDYILERIGPKYEEVKQRLIEDRQRNVDCLERLRSKAASMNQSADENYQISIATRHLDGSPTLGAIIEGALDKHAFDSGKPVEEVSYTAEQIAAQFGVSPDENGEYDEEEMMNAWNMHHQIEAQEEEFRRQEITGKEYRTSRQFRRELESRIPIVEHLGANRTHQARLYLTSSGQGAEINVVADRFQRLGCAQGSAAQAFLKHWMPRFDIGDGVDITNLDNAAVRIEVLRGEQRINLADLGFGAGQLLTMLLHIASILQQREADTAHSKWQTRVVLIEEPEANLHPQFQSLLAELFAETARQHRYLQFVIETHSEYLIRNAQVLVKNAGGNYGLLRKKEEEEERIGEPIKDAQGQPILIPADFKRKSREKKQTPGLFKVYYLDRPSEANNWQYGHEMRLRADGIFMDEFGSGFLDEAANKTFDLL